MTRKLSITLLSCICFFAMTGQTIQVHSIKSSRGSNQNVGYTLDGNWMTQGSRIKLLHTGNFGPSGIYPKTVQITDGYLNSGSLTQVTTLPYDNIFFFGAFDKLDPNLAFFTSDEIDSLYNWSRRGGKMIICSGQSTPPQTMPYDSRVLDLKWGIFWKDLSPGYFLATKAGDSTDIFNGPFGKFTGAYQGGSLQGYFSSLNPDTRILATNPDGKPTLIMDCKTLDLIIADVDGYTLLGNVTSTPTVLNDQDKFWVNSIVFMDKLQPLPKLNYTNSNLTLNASYVSYQWYRNNQPVAGASSAVFTPTQTGLYQAEVTFNGGCKQMSDSLRVDGNVGLGESGADEDFIKVIPNPSSGSPTLYFKKSQNNVMITLTDELGRTIRSQHFTGKELKMEPESLSAGVYLITIEGSGARPIRKKIVIK